jgi:hypothetical protein
VIPLAAVIALATAVGVGAGQRWPGAREPATRAIVTGLLWVATPIVAFFQIADFEPSVEAGAGLAFGYAGTGTAVALAYGAGRVLGLPRASQGALMLAAGLGNTGYLGLPVALTVLGESELANAVTYDILVSAVLLVTTFFSIGAAFGTAGEAPRERLRVFFTRNPALWAVAAGFLAPGALAPEWAVEASRLLVFAIIPLGFFVVGVTLAGERARGMRLFPPPLDTPVAVAVGLKLLVPPAVVLGLSWLLVDVPDAYVTQAGMASGVNSVVVAATYGLDRRIAAASVVWTTVAVVAAGLVAVAV